MIYGPASRLEVMIFPIQKVKVFPPSSDIVFIIYLRYDIRIWGRLDGGGDMIIRTRLRSCKNLSTNVLKYDVDVELQKKGWKMIFQSRMEI